jgi:hypothetical protein
MLLVHKSDNLTVICGFDCLENVGALASHNRVDLHGLLQGKLNFFFLTFDCKASHYCCN